MNIPSGGISDIERIEMQYPFVYFTRNFHRTAAGPASSSAARAATGFT